MQDTLRFILANRCLERPTTVTFYGGEALLARDRMEWMMTALRKEAGDDVRFSISSNGYALTPDVVDWICSIDNCEVYVTIDGYEELHDRNRRTVAGLPTYKTILQNLEYFKATYPEEYQQRVGFLVTLNKWNELPEVSDRWLGDVFLHDKLPKHLSFILPRSLQEMRSPVSPIGERARVLGLAFDRYMKGEKSLLTQQFVEWTDNIHQGMQVLHEDDELVAVTCLEDMYRVFVNAEGRVFLCERFCSEHSVGNVASGIVDEASLREMEERFIRLRNRHCTTCSAAALCTKCMTVLNYSDEELSALCDMERQMCALMKQYAWKRRMFDKKNEYGHRQLRLTDEESRVGMSDGLSVGD